MTWLPSEREGLFFLTKLSPHICALPAPTKRGGSRYKLPRSGGPGPDYVAYVVVFLGAIIICRVSKLYLSDQAQVTLHTKVSPSDLLQRCLAGPSLLVVVGGGFHPGPNSLSAALRTLSHFVSLITFVPYLILPFRLSLSHNFYLPITQPFLSPHLPPLSPLL